MKTPLVLLAAVALSAGALAQMPPGGPPAPVVSKDASSAATGTYKLDPQHASIIARIAHRGGLSYSTFRFGTSSGTLDWNAADPAKSQLKVTIETASITTPVPDFAKELIGDRFLKTGQYPTATFVSKSIERTGPNRGRISGDLTFMGQTRPATINTTFNGTAAVRGAPVLGFSGTLAFKRSAFGFSSMIGPIGDDLDIMIDVEFDKQA